MAITQSTYRCKNTTSTSTSSLSSCKKSFKKCETDSYVMCPQTTMCLLASDDHRVVVGWISGVPTNDDDDNNDKIK